MRLDKAMKTGSYKLKTTGRSKTILIIGAVVVLAAIGLGVYFGVAKSKVEPQQPVDEPSQPQRPDSTSDPLDRTVSLNLSLTRVSLADLLQRTSTQSSYIYRQVQEQPQLMTKTGIELYNILMYNTNQFMLSLFTCFNASRTNPRLALNIIKQYNRLWRVMESDVSFSQSVTTSPSPAMYGNAADIVIIYQPRHAYYPGPPEPSALNEMRQYGDPNLVITYRPLIDSMKMVLPLLIEFMLENGYDSLGDVLEMSSVDSTLYNQVKIKNQDLLDIFNLLQELLEDVEMVKVYPQAKAKVYELDKSYSSNELGTLLQLYGIFQQSQNNTYQAVCTYDILPTLSEQIRTTLLPDKVADFWNKMYPDRLKKFQPTSSSLL